jgi:hypothetical protein
MRNKQFLPPETKISSMQSKQNTVPATKGCFKNRSPEGIVTKHWGEALGDGACNRISDFTLQISFHMQASERNESC